MKFLTRLKSSILLGLMLLISLSLAADPVSPAQALTVAQNWLQHWQPQSPLQLDEIHIYAQSQLEKLEHNRDIPDSPQTELYLVYFESGSFAVIPADDNLRPILAYSSLPLKDKSDMPPAFRQYLNFYAQEVRDVREAKLKLEENRQLWTEIAANNLSRYTLERDVSPLISTTWNQNYPYNELCPADPAGPGGHVYAGCVATAMAQVMKYWNKPIQGTGSESYYAYGYGYQSANFGATTYLWDEMPNSLGYSNIPVATLLYHCAVGVEMNFAPDGSGSNGWIAQSAMQNYFSYPNAFYAEKDNYSNAAWENLLKAQLDNGVPMYYSGFGTDVGHAWNCDGYQAGNYFHFNLGWGGAYDGYFSLNSIIAGGNNLTSSQAAIINTIPANYSITAPRVQLSGQNSMAGDPFELCLSTYPVLSDWNVNSYSVSIFYEHTNLEYLGANADGSIAEGGSLMVDTSNPGYLSFTWNRASPLFGGGNLLNIHFQSIEPGEYLFIPVDMRYNNQILSNVEPLMLSIDAAVENLADSQITMSNAMHIAFNSLATLNVNTSYLLPSWNVTHYEFDLAYDPQKVQFHDLVSDETISQSAANLQAEIINPGLVHVFCDADSPLSGANSLLLKIRFLAVGNGSSTQTSVVSMSNFMYNDTAIASSPNSIILLSPNTSADEQFPTAMLQVQNYPNPFNPSTTILLDNPESGPVKAAIYNLKGQLIYTVHEGILTEGQHSFVWHGFDADGRPLGNGIYLLKVQSASANRINKLSLMK